jgi:hypothetical protein
VSAWLAIAALAVLAALAFLARTVWQRSRLPATVKIVDPEGRPQLAADGEARSVQAAELTMPAADLEKLWSPMALERVARTYWRFLSRITLGLIRVRYSDNGRRVVFIAPPLVLLSFDPPEYELDDRRGLVRWRIRSGLLVARRGRNGHGMLQIAVRRMDPPAPGTARIHVEVAVFSFYPSIATGISRRVYTMTQSAIHVIVTHAFLRSLARLDLADSRVGRFAE